MRKNSDQLTKTLNMLAAENASCYKNCDENICKNRNGYMKTILKFNIFKALFEAALPKIVNIG